MNIALSELILMGARLRRTDARNEATRMTRLRKQWRRAERTTRPKRNVTVRDLRGRFIRTEIEVPARIGRMCRRAAG